MVDILVLPELQNSEQAAGLLLRSGGSAANTAAWIAALGSSARFVGCVGGDAFGAAIVQELRASGAETVIRVEPRLETGCVAVEITDRGERMMRSSRGANQGLSPADILRAGSSDISWVHVSGYCLLGPYRFDLLDAALDVARAAGAPISFDPSSVGLIQSFGADLLLRELARREIRLLLPNRPEAEELSRRGDLSAAARLLAAQFSWVVIKDGHFGAVFHLGDKTARVPTAQISPMDTTGAGDAFNAAVIVASVRGQDLREACEFANQTALQAISSYGGRPRPT